MHVMPLAHHPATPAPHVREVTARVDALSEELLVFYFRVEGDLDRLRLPAPSRPVHTDGLWKQTCFEAFLRPRAARCYFELNFSPSGAWAAYRFSDYRQDMTAIEAVVPPPRILCRRRETALEIDIDVHLATLAAAGLEGELQLALSAVLQDDAGQVSYWALNHAPGKPDFHHPDSFVLALARGEAQ
jgi:hypothetical protein